jgi:hypothetical protein
MECPTDPAGLHSGCRNPEGLVQAMIRGPAVHDSPDGGDHEMQNIDVHCGDDAISGAGNPCSASRAGKSGQPQAPSLQAHRLGDVWRFPELRERARQQLCAILNKRGMVTGWADASLSDPYPNFCFDADCLVAHAFQWDDGQFSDLGVLPNGASSASTWISPNGLIAGYSEHGQIDPLIPRATRSSYRPLAERRHLGPGNPPYAHNRWGKGADGKECMRSARSQCGCNFSVVRGN